jgi:hypothetical protein
MASTPTNDEQERFVRAVEDVTAFPILTEDIGSIGTAGAPASAYGPGRSSYDSLVKNTLRDILNWGPRSLNDPQGFAAALTQSFNIQEIEGRTVTTHVPRSYVMQVQGDGGAVTGAQASIFARAQAAVQQSIPLLEGLYPLQIDSDPEDLAATVATLRLAMTELVDELGRQGGPRPQRVDSLFDLMLGIEITGKPVTTFNSDHVGGQLGLLRDRLGFELSRVNNAEEEKNLTNFLILADHAFTLWLSWTSLRTYFDRIGPNVFLGPQFVLLSRALAVIAEQVRETYFTLDSVFVGPAERETTRLPFAHPEPPLTLAELLEWAERFASEEAPQLMREAGKDGVIAFRPTLQRLIGLFTEAVAISRRESRNPSPGVHTLRASNALDSVLLQLRNAEHLAQPLSRTPPAKIAAVDPRQVDPRQLELDKEPLILRIEGEGFQPQSQVRIDLSEAALNEKVSVEARRVHFGSSSVLWATFDATEINDARGFVGDTVGNTVWSVVVRNPDSTHSSLSHALTILSGLLLPEPEPQPGVMPLIRRLLPNTGRAGETVSVKIHGRDFQEGATVAFEPGPQGEEDVTVLGDPVLTSDRLLEISIQIDGEATPGPRDVTVTNPGDQSDVLEEGFEILAGADDENEDAGDNRTAARRARKSR